MKAEFLNVIQSGCYTRLCLECADRLIKHPEYPGIDDTIKIRVVDHDEPNTPWIPAICKKCGKEV